MTSTRRFSALLAPLASFILGCGSYGVGGGDFLGATPGGAQDISQAREIIATGGVPTIDQFTVEGLYSEHDLTLAAPPPCNQALCVGAAAGLEVGLDDDRRDVFLQLGMSSNVSAANFTRKPLNLGIVVDVSGSMSENLAGVKAALHVLVDNLHDDDFVSLVVFESSAKTIQPSTLVSNKAALHAAVDHLEIGGSTAMEDGMKRGYDEIDGHVDAQHLSRLMVFTDAMPNVGSTDEGSFQAMATAAAAHDIGLTFFGFGSNFDAAFVDQIAHLRGGNYRFVRAEDVKTIFADELDFLVTPIAYDLRVQASPPPGAPLRTVYGVPQSKDHVNGELFDVSTVFLSKRKGAIVLRLDGATLPPLFNGSALALGGVNLRYQTVDGVEETSMLDASIPLASVPAADETLYPNPQIARTLAVTDEYLVMHRVCDAFHKGSLDLTDANARLDSAIAKLTSADASLHDDNLKREIALLGKLKNNLASGGAKP